VLGVCMCVRVSESERERQSMKRERVRESVDRCKVSAREAWHGMAWHGTVSEWHRSGKVADAANALYSTLTLLSRNKNIVALFALPSNMASQSSAYYARTHINCCQSHTHAHTHTLTRADEHTGTPASRAS
jgi:hypothetical protein